MGVDFKQPAIVKGLLLLGPQNTRTQAAQAMYRLRKLNRGHTIDVGACPGFLVVGKTQKLDGVLAALQAQEASEQAHKDILLKLQYVKYMGRCDKVADANAYAEEAASTGLDAPQYSANTAWREMTRLLHFSFTEESAHLFANLVRSDLIKTIDTLTNRGDAVETAVVTNTDTDTAVTTNTDTNRVAFRVLDTFRVITSDESIWNWTINSGVVSQLLEVAANGYKLVLSGNPLLLLKCVIFFFL